MNLWRNSWARKAPLEKLYNLPRGNPDGVFTNMTVIGVVKDYVYGNIYGKAYPLIMFCKPPEYQNFIYARLKPQSDVEKAVAKMAAVMKKDNPAYPLEYQFVDDQFNQCFKMKHLQPSFIGICNTCNHHFMPGFIRLAAYTAERRIKEIGIRKVLGASVSGITALLSKDFLQLVAIACFIAFPVAWWIMHNWLQSYQYRITISWWIFFIAGVAAIMIALITISFQAIKAALANPVKNLRTE